MSSSVAVIGTIFIDCKGFAQGAYQPDSRNLGRIQFVHGGVARNVAENMANLEVPVSFVATVDQSGIGHEVTERLKQWGVQTGYVRQVASGGMGMWLAILDETGNLAGSISQMPELGHLEQWIADKGEEIAQRSSHIVLELDLTEVVARRVLDLAARHGRPVYGIPGNLDVVMKHPELLSRLECFICNHHEAGRLLGADLTGDPELPVLSGLLRRFVDERGLRSMVITLGERGSVYYDRQTGESGCQPVFPVQLVDSTGAGDAFFSGTVAGLVRGLPLGQAVVCGTKVAGWTIESTESTCLTLREKMSGDPFFAELKARR